jgi:carboxymethylenebutenolidase
MSDFIYESKKNANFVQSNQAIIVLPDIYGVTDYAKETSEELANQFRRPVYMLDYFYQLTGQTNNISQSNSEVALSLMQKMTGEDFVTIFNKCVKEISYAQPNLVEISVVGFCFAGRLAYLTGLEPKVNKIVSFYGAGVHTPNFYKGQTVLGALENARNGDTILKILAFYGTLDESIPESDRVKTQKELQSAGIEYGAKEYEAPHAYFQPGRDNYTEVAAESSWQDIKNFL